MNLLNGTAYLIWIDVTTPLTAERGLDYRPIVCGVSNGFGMDIESISTRNKCDGGYDQSKGGYLSWSFDMDGFAVGLKMADKIAKANFQEIALLALNKTEFWAKMEDLETTITREGKVRITQYRETADLDSPYSFTANFIGIGKPILETNIFKTVLATDITGTELVQDGNNNLIENYDGN
jgi:hypothetical protein